MSDAWSSPDPRRVVVTGTAFGLSYERVEDASPPLRHDVAAGLLAFVVTVLAGAPVGLLWSALAPRAEALRVGELYLAADRSSSAFIAGDGFFLGAVLVAGLVTGLVAWWFGRAHGPAVVLGLAAGGVAAAAVAMVVGERAGVAAYDAAVRAGQDRIDVTLVLMAREALAGWPVAALLAFAVPTLLTDRGPELLRAEDLGR